MWRAIMSRSYWEGVALVEKVAMNRPMRELFSRLSEQYPEHAKSFRGPNPNINAIVPGHEVQDDIANMFSVSDSISKRLGREWSDIYIGNTPWARLRNPHAEYYKALVDRSSSGLQEATARQAVDRRFSGAHTVKPGESFIPSAGNAELVRKNSDAPGDILYRGNPIDMTAEREMHYMSRHPEIAAGYASGDAAMGGYTPQTNRMFAYRKTDFKQDPTFGGPMPEAAADWQRIGPSRYTEAEPKALEQLRAQRATDPTGEQSDTWFHANTVNSEPANREKRPQRHPENRADLVLGKRHPTYETMVTPSMIPEPIAEYTVRRARDGNQIGYAMKPVTQK